MSIGGNHSWDLVVASFYENLNGPTWRTRATEVTGYPFDYTYSFLRRFVGLQAPGAWVEIVGAAQAQSTFCWSPDKYLRGARHTRSRMRPTTYVPQQLLIEQAGLFFGESTPQAIRSLPNNNITVDPSLITKLLVAAAGSTQKFHTSFATILIRLYAMQLGDFPIPQTNESKTCPNLAPIITDADPQVQEVDDYWPLSSDNDQQLPVVQALFIDLSNFMLNYNDNAINVLLPPGFKKQDYGQSCAVVPIIENMLNDAGALRSWILAHMEFPWRARGIETNLSVFADYDNTTNVDVGAQDVMISNIYLNRVPGPTSRVLFVVLDRFLPAVNQFTLNLVNTNNQANVQLLLNDMVPVPIQGILNNPAVYSPEFGHTMQWFSQLYGNPFDFRTASAAVAEMMIRKPDLPREQKDPNDNWTLRSGYLTSLVGANNPTFQTPAGQSDIPFLPFNAIPPMYSSFRSPSNRLPQTRANTQDGIPSYTIWDYTVEAQVLVTTGYYLRAPEVIGDIADPSMSFESDKTVVDLLIRISKLAEIRGACVDAVYRKRGTPLAVYWPDSQYEMTAFRELQGDTAHLMTHMCYTGFAVVPSTMLSNPQILWRDNNYPLDLKRSLLMTQVDVDLYKQKYCGLRPEATRYLGDTVDVTDKVFNTGESLPDGLFQSVRSMYAPLFRVEEKRVGNKVVPTIFEFEDKFQLRLCQLTCQTDVFLTIGAVSDWVNKDNWVVGVGNTQAQSFNYSAIYYRFPVQLGNVISALRNQENKPGILTPFIFQPPIIIGLPAWFVQPGGESMTTSKVILSDALRYLAFNETFLPLATSLSWTGRAKAIQTGELVANEVNFVHMFGGAGDELDEDF